MASALSSKGRQGTSTNFTNFFQTYSRLFQCKRCLYTIMVIIDPNCGIMLTLVFWSTTCQLQYGAQFSAGPSSRPLFVQRLFFAPQMNLNKNQLFPKVAWFLVFHPAKFLVYRFYIVWARRGDAKVGEFGFPETVFVYGYSNYMV